MAVHANDLLLQRLLWRLGYIEAPVKVCDKCDDIVIRAGAAARQCTSNRIRALSTYSRCAETLLSAVNLDDINGISRLLRTVSNVNDLTETLSPLSMAARKGYVYPALPTPTSVPVCIEYKLSQLTFVLGRQGLINTKRQRIGAQRCVPSCPSQPWQELRYRRTSAGQARGC